jgi:hypothetical protein
MLAELQCTNIGDDRPAVSRGNLIGVIRHSAKAVCDDVEKVANRRYAKAINMIRRRGRKSALDDHSLSVASAIVAGRAKDIETLSPAPENLRHCFPLITRNPKFLRHRLPRERFNRFPVQAFALKERPIDVQMTAGDRAGNERPR